MGDVEDPEIYCAQSIYEWQQTEQGKWCMEKATDTTFNIMADPNGFEYRVTITGWLSGKYATFYAIKNT